MAINYDKWNNIEDYTSDENEDETPLSYIKNSDSGKSGKLLTIPWDTFCEKARWALDLYQTKYIEYGYPYPLHIWYIIDEYSEPPPTPQITDVPILEFNNQVYTDCSKIFIFLYSRALGSKLRIYSNQEALTHEKYFDENLAPAAKTIFYSMVLPSKKLCEDIIFKSIHLSTWRTLYRLIWPIAKMNMKNIFGVRNKKVQEEAWDKVEETFKYADDLLSKSDGEYLLGKTLTAADITFAAHAIPILCPNAEEHIWFNDNGIGIRCPSIKDLPANLKSKVESYRLRPSGAFAMKLYKTKRGKSCGSKPSRYAKENTPLWAQEYTLRRFVYGLFILAVALGWFFVLSNPWYISLITYFITSFLLIRFIIKPLKESQYGRRITRIMFYFFNNNGHENIKSHVHSENCQCHSHEEEKVAATTAASTEDKKDQ